ncbi:MAG: hypothetical protein OEX98_01265 [Nitrosopumilus sp.]|nr:hypothetical protein [Nitrosopumilus sp.]
MVCNGVCHRYKAKKPGTSSRYASGQKWCTNCEIFIHWDGKYCPCCDYVLRTKPRGTETRRRLLEKLEIKRI